MPEDVKARVKIAISAEIVLPGFWNGDEKSEYAVAMETDKGRIAWHRSMDWVTFAQWNGWNRVARIIEA